mmetsp:Transcript_112817/g.325919  ORF Transcript_112817/g.325919 Transcript_112817/m.325919 type:complete len:270 (+) Transcript_112817:215-1024(+)
MANEPSSDIFMQTMCLCVPLRLGILFASCWQFIVSLMYVIDKPMFEHVLRHFTGGYCLASRVVIGTMEVTGVLFGMLGILGTWYCKPSYIASLNLWQIARLVAWMVMFYIDVPLVMHCEDWVNAVQTMTEEHGWNPVLYETALAGKCASERSHFFALSLVTLIVFMYLVNATSRYQSHMDRVPKHLLKIPKDAPMVFGGTGDPAAGIFYAHSLGERAYLNGDYGTLEHAPPIGAGGVSMPQPGAVYGGYPNYGPTTGNAGYGPADFPPL